jgi:soluble lytic murein transglycosylase-like protein
MARLRRAPRYHLDTTTVVVMLLSMMMLNVLLFSAGFLVGVSPRPHVSGTPRPFMRLARLTPRPFARVAPAPKAPFVMPRWTPPADPADVPQAVPAEVIAYQQRDYTALIEETAYRESVPPYLVAAVMSVESNFDASAVSNKGARGLMQVMPNTARRFGFDAKRLQDPVHNVAAGATYLRWLLARYDGDLDRVLAAYNAGEGAVDTYNGIPPYKETQNFVKRVRAAMRKNAGETSV